ncbi:hypothetical protein SDJN02_26588, partial [Cucurbita argyrosperma subsp. argyrosperma]
VQTDPKPSPFLNPLRLPPNSAVEDSPSPSNRPNPPALRCRTTTWRLKTWSGMRNCRPSHTHALAATCSRLRRRILSSVKRLLGALAVLFTSQLSTTWKIFLETLIRRITKDLSPPNNSLLLSLENSEYSNVNHGVTTTATLVADEILSSIVNSETFVAIIVSSFSVVFFPTPRNRSSKQRKVELQAKKRIKDNDLFIRLNYGLIKVYEVIIKNIQRILRRIMGETTKTPSWIGFSFKVYAFTFLPED